MHHASAPTRPRALILHGGWEGHTPDATADFAEQHLLPDFDVTRAATLDVLNPTTLASFDLLLPIWTFGEITPAQESALLTSVERGLGVLAWHGALSAFLESRPHKLLLGGQFVAHPGDEDVTYDVHFLDDPLTADLPMLRTTTEQYYLLVDPAVRILATTTIVAPSMPWLSGVSMPVAWTRAWGSGRVAYCAIGHRVEDLALPQVRTFLTRAASWASRRPSPQVVTRATQATVSR